MKGYGIVWGVLGVILLAVVGVGLVEYARRTARTEGKPPGTDDRDTEPDGKIEGRDLLAEGLRVVADRLDRDDGDDDNDDGDDDNGGA